VVTELTTTATQTDSGTATEPVGVAASTSGGDETIELVELHEHREVVHMHHYHYLHPTAAAATTTTTTTTSLSTTAAGAPPQSQPLPSPQRPPPASSSVRATDTTEAVGASSSSSASVLLTPVASTPKSQKRLTTDEIAERLQSRGTGSRNTLPGCAAICAFICVHFCLIVEIMSNPICIRDRFWGHTSFSYGLLAPKLKCVENSQ